MKILKQLGIVLIPTSFVTLLGRFFAWSEQDTAGIAIAVLLLVSLYLMRRVINRFASVHFAAIGTLLVIALSYHLHMASPSVLKIYEHSSDFQNDLAGAFTSTKDDIWCLATDVTSHLPTRKAEVLAKLQGGVHFRYLLLNPFSDSLPGVAKAFGMKDVKRLRAESLASLKQILNVRTEWDKMAAGTATRGELEVKFIDQDPRSRLYIFDPKRGSGTVVVVPYVAGHGSMNLPAFVLSNTKPAVTSEYIVSFENLWNTAEELTDLLRRHPELELGTSPNGSKQRLPTKLSSTRTVRTPQRSDD